MHVSPADRGGAYTSPGSCLSSSDEKCDSRLVGSSVRGREADPSPGSSISPRSCSRIRHGPGYGELAERSQPVWVGRDESATARIAHKSCRQHERIEPVLLWEVASTKSRTRCAIDASSHGGWEPHRYTEIEQSATCSSDPKRFCIRRQGDLFPPSPGRHEHEAPSREHTVNATEHTICNRRGGRHELPHRRRPTMVEKAAAASRNRGDIKIRDGTGHEYLDRWEQPSAEAIGESIARRPLLVRFLDLESARSRRGRAGTVANRQLP
ncbi:hypothetical protein DCS_03528 [Drechmeria coniospora]|uniref:Uncharacterized protein n=1 Tax=Drechmeria coniospora TaxID=98403 RepID=A0A151GHH6_DRECN|nr:hypothetical protein DCS_03528 [Drechmeria coniospora]KYK56528.1 hypothetical protein DCS_03528 [Drechmeria coniospora]